MADLFAQALNGLSYGVLLFLLSVGLTLIFGMLDVVNLAHGSYYMLGAYAGLSAHRRHRQLLAGPGAGSRSRWASWVPPSSEPVCGRSTGAARWTRCS